MSKPVARRGCRWTPEEEQKLEAMWGVFGIPTIAARLGRTVGAVSYAAKRLGLGSSLEASGMVTFHQLLSVLGVKSCEQYTRRSWTGRYGLPVVRRRVIKSVVVLVNLDKFWAWAATHRHLIDFSRLEPMALGREPDWVAGQRRIDYNAAQLCRRGKWTEAETRRLIGLLGLHKYTAFDLAELMQRSYETVLRKINALGLRDQLIRADNRHAPSSWTPEMEQMLADGIRRGEGYSIISGRMGVSAKAVRGYAYRVYSTERPDSIRAMMGDGPWGTGAPTVTVRLGIKRTTYAARVRRDAQRLVDLLQMRLEEIA